MALLQDFTDNNARRRALLNMGAPSAPKGASPRQLTRGVAGLSKKQAQTLPAASGAVGTKTTSANQNTGLSSVQAPADFRFQPIVPLPPVTTGLQAGSDLVSAPLAGFFPGVGNGTVAPPAPAATAPQQQNTQPTPTTTQKNTNVEAALAELLGNDPTALFQEQGRRAAGQAVVDARSRMARSGFGSSGAAAVLENDLTQQALLDAAIQGQDQRRQSLTAGLEAADRTEQRTNENTAFNIALAMLAGELDMTPEQLRNLGSAAGTGQQSSVTPQSNYVGIFRDPETGVVSAVFTDEQGNQFSIPV